MPSLPILVSKLRHHHQKKLAINDSLYITSTKYKSAANLRQKRMQCPIGRTCAACSLNFKSLLISLHYRQLLQFVRLRMPHYPDQIQYSDKYVDDYYEYRHVILPKETYKKMPRTRLLTESEWRAIGVQQSRGWIHYQLHRPEPHILLFRRAKGCDPQTGLPPPGFVAPPDTFIC